MILARSTHPRWLSNSWLVAAASGSAGGSVGACVVVDAGGPVAPLLSFAGEHGLRVDLVVLTHHHEDHVAERQAFAPARIVMHELDATGMGGGVHHVADGDVIDVGGLRLTMLHVPGHTLGQLNVLCEAAAATGDEARGHSAGEEQGAMGRALARTAVPPPGTRLFSGDTLFRGSVGGTRAPGHGTFEQLRGSIDRLLELPSDTIVCPGHGEPTTIARERESNPFVRAWRGADATLDEPCTAMGRAATLLTWARDHDGGWKAWVRWNDDGGLDVVPGSRVERG